MMQMKDIGALLKVLRAAGNAAVTAGGVGNEARTVADPSESDPASRSPSNTPGPQLFPSRGSFRRESVEPFDCRREIRLAWK